MHSEKTRWTLSSGGLEVNTFLGFTGVLLYSVIRAEYHKLEFLMSWLWILETVKSNIKVLASVESLLAAPSYGKSKMETFYN